MKCNQKKEEIIYPNHVMFPIERWQFEYTTPVERVFVLRNRNLFKLEIEEMGRQKLKDNDSILMMQSRMLTVGLWLLLWSQVGLGCYSTSRTVETKGEQNKQRPTQKQTTPS